MPREYVAEKLTAIEPIQFHHEHDTGVSDLQTARFEVSFSLLRPEAEWVESVRDWLTDNCSGAFEVQNIEPAAWDLYMMNSGRNYDARKANWQRGVIFAQESDATLAYLRFK